MDSELTINNQRKLHFWLTVPNYGNKKTKERGKRYKYLRGQDERKESRISGIKPPYSEMKHNKAAASIK